MSPPWQPQPSAPATAAGPSSSPRSSPPPPVDPQPNSFCFGPGLANRKGAQLPANVKAEARKSWAQSLGTRGGGGVVEDEPCITVPRSNGLWDAAMRGPQDLKPMKRGSTFPSPRGWAEAAKAASATVSSQAKPSVSNAWMPQRVPLSAVQVEEARQAEGHIPSFAEREQLLRRPSKESRPSAVTLAVKPIRELLDLIFARLRYAPKLWLRCPEDERRLRRRCFRDQLCRQAQLKYTEQAISTSSSWEAFLRTAQGSAQIARWADKRIREQQEKQSSAKDP